MLKVAKHIVEGYMIHRVLIGRIEADKVAKSSDRATHYVPLVYADPAQARPFRRLLALTYYSSFREANPYATHVQGFMANLSVVD